MRRWLILGIVALACAGCECDPHGATAYTVKQYTCDGRLMQEWHTRYVEHYNNGVAFVENGKRYYLSGGICITETERNVR